MGQQHMDKPPAEAKPSAEEEHAPEPHKIQAAPVVAIAGVPVRIPRWKKDGSLVWQKLRGRPSEGAEMVNVARWAIAVCDADPLEVVKTVIGHLPESVLAKCKNADRDLDEIGNKIAHLLPDEGLRSEMITRWLDCIAANPDVEQISENRWRVDQANIGLLDKLLADMERVDQANIDLLHEPRWRTIPEKVLLVILRELYYPRPDNLTR
jgi:hypothetical protein